MEYGDFMRNYLCYRALMGPRETYLDKVSRESRRRKSDPSPDLLHAILSEL